MREIAPLTLPGCVPAAIGTLPPVLEVVAPGSLYVDDAYQRGLSDRSIKLIRKIVAEWDWRAFKPPVVVRVEGRLEVIDGQHTAIAAITHGGIESLPVLLIQAEEQAGRAAAFVRHNRDRIQVTPTQLHNAMVAAGDEDALTIDQVCARSGIRVLRNAPPMGKFAPGDTVAITTLRALINRRHPHGAKKVLQVCSASQAAPVSADLIKAAECLLFAEEYAGEIDAERIIMVLTALSSTIEQEAQRFAAERKVPRWRALASVIFMNRRRARNV